MATEERHITRIETTEALFRSNGDHGQSAILTDQNEEWVYYNDDKSLLYYAAAQKTWDGAAWAYIDNDFGEVTLHDDLLVDEYIKRSGGTDDYIRFENAKITIALTGADILVVEDDHLYISQDTRIGDAGAATELLEIRKDQDDKTVVKLANYNNHADAASEFRSHSLGVFGVFGSYPALYDESECQNKTIVSSSKDLALIGYDDEIQFYAGGHSASDKVLVLSPTKISINAIGNDIDTEIFSSVGSAILVDAADNNVSINPGLGVGVSPNAANMLEVAGETRIGDAGAATELLEVRKDQDTLTRIQVKNTNNHASAQAAFYSESNVVSGIFGSYPSIYATLELQDKTIVYSTKKLALFGIDDEIQFYAGGSTASDKLLVLSATQLITQLASIKTGEFEHNVEDCVLRCDINTGEIYGELYE